MAEVVLERLRKVFEGKRSASVAVEALDLEIKEGEFVSLVGPSGCGKTTTLRMIAGLEQPTSGRVLFNGADVTHLSVQRRNISMVFQNYAIFPHMTVSQNIGYGLRVAKEPPASRERKVGEAAELVGIGDLLERYPRQLSGGQRQRVALARALARRPGLVLFDEPLSNLDAKLRDQTRAELKRLHRELANTMIYVTHDQLEALTLSSRLAVMRNGKMQQYDTPRQVFNAPVNMYVAGFIGSPSMNFFEGYLEDGADGPRVVVGPSIAFLIDPAIARAASNRQVVVGIRPQHVTLRDVGDQANWTVTVVEPVGTEAIVHLDCDGRRLIAVDRGDRYLEGHRLAAGCPIQHLHVFDAASTQRIRLDA